MASKLVEACSVGEIFDLIAKRGVEHLGIRCAWLGMLDRRASAIVELRYAGPPDEKAPSVESIPLPGVRPDRRGCAREASDLRRDAREARGPLAGRGRAPVGVQHGRRRGAPRRRQGAHRGDHARLRRGPRLRRRGARVHPGDGAASAPRPSTGRPRTARCRTASAHTGSWRTRASPSRSPSTRWTRCATSPSSPSARLPTGAGWICAIPPPARSCVSPWRAPVRAVRRWPRASRTCPGPSVPTRSVRRCVRSREGEAVLVRDFDEAAWESGDGRGPPPDGSARAPLGHGGSSAGTRRELRRADARPERRVAALRGARPSVRDRGGPARLRGHRERAPSTRRHGATARARKRPAGPRTNFSPCSATSLRNLARADRDGPAPDGPAGGRRLRLGAGDHRAPGPAHDSPGGRPCSTSRASRAARSSSAGAPSRSPTSSPRRSRSLQAPRSSRSSTGSRWTCPRSG